MSEVRETYELATRPTVVVPIDQAHTVAKQLSQIVEQCNLAVRIGQGKHVRVEGWITLCMLLKIPPPQVVSVERYERPAPNSEVNAAIRERLLAGMEQAIARGDFDAVDRIALLLKNYPAQTIVGYRAVAELKIGDIVYRAEAICENSEPNWRGKDEYAICSMAQTRACAKTCRIPLGWIMPLAGYQATPLEEMDTVIAQAEPAPEAPAPERPARRRENGNRNGDDEIWALRAEIAKLWRELYPAEGDASREAFRIFLQQRYNTDRLGALSKEQLVALKSDLERERSEASA